MVIPIEITNSGYIQRVEIFKTKGGIIITFLATIVNSKLKKKMASLLNLGASVINNRFIKMGFNAQERKNALVIQLLTAATPTMEIRLAGTSFGYIPRANRL